MAKIRKEILPSRLQFDVLDLLRAARGFDRPEGYAVVPQDIMQEVEKELERLYNVEALAAEVLTVLLNETYPAKESQLFLDLQQQITGTDIASDRA